ncbi:MAG: glycosyltransferase family protein [Cyanobacteria bacterium HKST-UBA02]|nr:glycosyltransferase family protein [Cyanobacteria bacterium HKST-UBA02]
MILAVLQARVTSSRLPGKVLKPLLGEPMLWRQIERILSSRKISQLVVATSEDTTDDGIERLCAEKGVACYRGSLDDVLQRFYEAANGFSPEHVVRLTGDCPLADPAVIDAVIERHLSGGYDYTSNSIERTYPDGLDVEVMKFSVLQTACQEARLSSEREHVTPFIYKHPERFAIGQRRQGEDLSSLRWTVDEPQDLVLIEKIYEALYPIDPGFGQAQILELLSQNPDLLEINRGFAINEGYRKSLERDFV